MSEHNAPYDITIDSNATGREPHDHMAQLKVLLAEYWTLLWHDGCRYLSDAQARTRADAKIAAWRERLGLGA